MAHDPETGRNGTAVTEVYEEGPPPEDPGPPPPWWRENWWMWLLALLLAVLVLLGVVWAVQREDEEPAGAEQASTVPNVVGLEEEDARAAVEQAGYEPDVRREEATEPEGTVISQDPEPGTELEAGDRVLLVVSQGPPATVTETQTQTETATQTETVEDEPELAQVPDVVGAGHVEAGATVEEAGFAVDTYPVESEEPRGTVIAQTPTGGTDLATGESVRLNVSVGTDERPAATIPNVTGEEEGDARRLLREAGFTVRTLDRAAPEPRHVGVVILQDPEPRNAPELTQITIYVGR